MAPPFFHKPMVRTKWTQANFSSTYTATCTFSQLTAWVSSSTSDRRLYMLSNVSLAWRQGVFAFFCYLWLHSSAAVWLRQQPNAIFQPLLLENRFQILAKKNYRVLALNAQFSKPRSCAWQSFHQHLLMHTPKASELAVLTCIYSASSLIYAAFHSTSACSLITILCNPINIRYLRKLPWKSAGHGGHC